MSLLQSLVARVSPSAAQAPAAAPQENSTQPTQPAQPAEAQSPLDNFKDLWQTSDNSQEANANNQLFSIDPKAMRETVSKMNFMGQIPPKVQEALKAGGEEAVKANLWLMNQAAQQAFMQNTQTTAKIVEAALAKQAEQFEQQVSGIIKKTGIKSELQSAHPVLAHQAAAPILEGIQTQLLRKHPNASQQELATMAQDYLITFAKELTGAGKQDTSPKAKDGTDFSDFF